MHDANGERLCTNYDQYKVMIHMKKESIIILFLLLMGSTNGSTINVPDDFAAIQLAIDSVENGDEIIVQPGEFRENLIIDKSISINGVGQASSLPVIVPAAGGSAIELLHDGISLSGLKIANEEGSAKTAISITSNNNSIHDIEITGKYEDDFGIYLLDNKNNSIFNCTLKQVYRAGIYVLNSSENLIYNNNIFKCQNGIYLRYSSGNRLSNNTISNNVYGIVYETIFDKIENEITANDFSDNVFDQPVKQDIGHP